MGAHGPRLILREPAPAPEAGCGKVFDLPLDGVLRAGSAPGCQIRISRPGVLEAHCWFKCQGGRAAVFVKDPQARITVNGAQVQKKLLEPGDTIRIGDAELEYEAAAKDPLVGKSLAGYRIEERLGLGAMGTVYKATQLSLERCVALKILSPELTKDREFVTEFLSEARAAAKLNHPHVVQIYDAGAVPVATLGLEDSVYASGNEGAGAREGEGPSLYFFSMEFLPGGTVSRLLEKEGKLPLDRALQIGRDTARALVWAEEHGIVHRDIKPDNLLFAADGAAKVADLGIAADLYGAKGNGDGERRQRGVGSPRYMAPEQAIGGAIDHRADIYALGSTLYRLISGRPPFEGKSAAEILKAKTSTDAPPLEAMAPDVPPAVAALVDRMIARDPEGRPATCVEVLSEIEEAIHLLRSGGGDDEPHHADDEDDTRNTGAPRPKRKRRRGAEGRPYVETTGGKVTILASGLMILSSLVFAVIYEPPQPESVVTTREATQPAEPDPPIAEPTDDEEVAVAKKKPASDPSRRAKKSTSQVAVLRKLTTIESDYKAGFLTGPKALEMIVALKKEHPEAVFQEEADRTLKFIQEVRLTAGKSALAKLLPTIRQLLEKKDFNEAAKKLAELRTSYPEIGAEIDAELKKVDVAADEAWAAAMTEADRLASTADYAGAVARLKEDSAGLPTRLEKAAQAKIAALEASEKEHASISKALAAELEKVEDAVAALDFDKAISIASAIPQLKSPVLAWKRTLAIEEAKLLQEAWKALQAGVAKKSAANETMDLGFGAPSGAAPVPAKLKGLTGGTITYQAASAAKVDGRDISGLSTKCLRELAAAGAGGGPDALPARLLEGLGLFILDRQGPARGSEILADPLLGETKVESYKVRLEEEKESFLRRVARVAQARAAKVKGKVVEAEVLTADLAAWIASARPLPGYDRVKETLAKAYLAARSETVRVGAPQSLISGRVQSYKPDGSIEILYDFNSEAELKDFRTVKGGGSLIELSEGRAKLRGEFRIGKGEMFRNRLSLLARVPADGYSPPSPNINFALWTNETDKLTPKVPENDAEAIPQPGEEPVSPAGLPQDYFVFGVGYRAHVYNMRHRAFEYLSLRGTNTPIQMPVYALIGGRRGMRVHEVQEDDCVWAMPAAGKVKNSQVIKIVMKAGEMPSWTVNSRTMTIKDGKGTDLLRRAEPYTGSVTIFTNGEVIDLDSLLIEAELNPAWIDAQLAAIAEKELKRIEPNYPFEMAKPNPDEEWNELLEGAGPKRKTAKKNGKATGTKASPPVEEG